LKRFMNSVLTATAVLGGMALLSVPAVAQRGGGGAPVPDNCPAQPDWQVKSLADYQAQLDKENPPAPAAPGGGGRGAGGGGGGRGAAGGGAAAAGGAAGGGGRGAGGGGGRGGRGGGAAAELPPVPRIPNEPQYGVQAGKPDLGGLAKGVWNVPYIINMQSQGRAENGCPVIVPFKPAALALWEDRELRNKEAGDPESFCLPPGVPRMMYTPYPTEIFQLPDRILFIYEGGAHVWRIIWMDGRQQPKDPNPNYLGYSVGHWEGDTLVVDTIGMNDRTWLDAAGHGHGEKLHVIEKFTRPDSNTLRLEATIEDPDYYTKPWTVNQEVHLLTDTELLEFICNENNRDVAHLPGK